MRSCRLKFLATAAVFAGVVAFAFTGSPAFAAPDVVEGVEIDANIEYDTDGDFDWGSEDPSHLANCLIDETPFPLDSPTGVCTGEPGAVLIQDPTSAKGAIDPNIHKGGDKLSDPANWEIISGNVPVKDDLGNVYAFKKEADGNGMANLGETIVYMGWEREANNGDSYVDFEFNAAIISCEDVDDPADGIQADECAVCVDTNMNGELDAGECPFPTPGNISTGLPGRSPGDLVFSYKLGTVTGNNDLPNEIRLILLEADGNGDLDFDNPLMDLTVDPDGSFNNNTGVPGAITLADLDDGEDLSGLIEFSLCGGFACEPQTLVVGLNAQTIQAGIWGTVQKSNMLAAGEIDNFDFTELSLNLDNIGLGPSCPGSAFLTVKSKSSQSDTADLKDTTKGVPFDLTNCGTIIIEKETIGGQDGTFDYTTDLNLDTVIVDQGDGGTKLTSSTFDLATTASVASITFTQVTPGTYAFTEGNPSPFDLKDVVCVDSITVNSSPQAQTAQALATVVLDANETVTCSYRNEGFGQLSLTKQIVNACTDNANDGGLFNLVLDLGEASVFAIADQGDNGSTGLRSFDTGNHTVSESAGTGTSLSDYSSEFSSGDCTDQTVNLSAGETVNCTVTNTRLPKLKVIKSGGAASQFKFKINGVFVNDDNGTAPNDTFVDGDMSVEVLGVIGNNKIEEFNSAGGAVDTTNDFLVSFSCTDGTNGTGTSTDDFAMVAGDLVICTFYNNPILTGRLCVTPNAQ